MAVGGAGAVATVLASPADLAVAHAALGVAEPVALAVVGARPLVARLPSVPCVTGALGGAAAA